MATRKQSRGTCAYCGKTMAKGGISKHLATCPQRQAVITKAEQGKIKQETLYHLRVEDAYDKNYWLDLEMRGSKTLNDLDTYLRAIWLECCGHMSQFSLGTGGFGQEIGKTRKIGDLLRDGDQLTHIYDFGTSSETVIKVVKIREGKPSTPKPIALMARNEMPDYQCMECDQSATHLCMECMIEDGTPGMLCDVHTETHPHDDYGEPIALVNSPRLGMCGYTGPSDPPY